jgi:TetR/AcrR family transcriptional repressor of nem operon
LIYERGVAGTSLDDVRAATSTSKSQLYHYFTGKQALVRAVIDRQVERVLQAQQPELDALDSVEALRQWRDRVVTLNRRTGGCPLGRLAGELTEGDTEARRALVAGFEAWQDRLSAGMERMRARRTSRRL